ncbi:MAG: hypothetical protein II909_02070 [Kiritimatiellae bacterium]|nr:hypothetical protein [Kiritimatiellia bacterium]
MGYNISTEAVGGPDLKNFEGSQLHRVTASSPDYIHTDAVYNALINAAGQMEERLKESLENYQQHPDVQANLQQLQYDLQQWNLALTTMTNINKNMGDALNSIASNFR